MNKQWHQEHTLSKDATPIEKVSWYEAHRKYCDCTPIPGHILKQMPPGSDQS